MPTSVWATEIQDILDEAGSASTVRVAVGDRTVDFPRPFPSPADWRDLWIYQIMVDRFDHPTAPPHHPPWDGICDRFQGGTLNGVRAQLDYLAGLGVGAIWLSPVLKNCQYRESYHGYGIQDFLALDPRLASDPAAARADPHLVEAEFEALVDEAHARGLYVIADIVLNHCGDVFEYEGYGSQAPWSPDRRTICWRDEHGVGRREWREGAPNGHPDAAVQPRELYRNDCFRRQGVGGEAGGDFYALKELVTAFSEYHPQRGHYAPVRDTLIRAHQYFIARYDVDGFRIDTLKYIEPEFARIFANAIREMALGIGKKNFFTFGEVYDEEEQIARFVGRSAHETGDAIGVDAALDFPLFYRLPGVVKGFQPPGEVAAVFERRKQVQRGLLSTHGDASKFFVTFLDNHDQHARCYFRDPAAPHRFDDQLTLGVALLFALQGIPCLYYGTEQGLAGTRERYTPGAHLCPEAVREALWGRNAPDSFDTTHPFYRAVQGLSQLRRLEPALRYGRQYFRALSGNGRDFGISWTPRGVLAVSRVLNDREVLAVANTNADQSWSGEVIVDFALNPTGATYVVLFSNRDESHRASPGPVAEKPAGGVAIHEVDGAVTNGPARALPVTLAPLEIQILRKED